jgi:hypothetical protein
MENLIADGKSSESLVERVRSLKAATYESLEFLLNCLCAFGKPVLHRMDKGWYCKVSMHVAAKGTSFEVGSEFTCETSLAAARQCAQRIIATMEAIEGGNQ